MLISVHEKRRKKEKRTRRGRRSGKWKRCDWHWLTQAQSIQYFCTLVAHSSCLIKQRNLSKFLFERERERESHSTITCVLFEWISHRNGNEGKRDFDIRQLTTNELTERLTVNEKLGEEKGPKNEGEEEKKERKEKERGGEREEEKGCHLRRDRLSFKGWWAWFRLVTRPTNDSPSPMVDLLLLFLLLPIHSLCPSSFHLSVHPFLTLSLHSFTECITRSHDILPCLSQFKFLLKIFPFEASCLTLSLSLLSSLSLILFLSHFLSSPS